MRQTVKKAKYAVCVSSEVASKSRVIEQRLKTLKAIIEVRERLGDAVEKEEIPKDLIDIIYNIADYV